MMIHIPHWVGVLIDNGLWFLFVVCVGSIIAVFGALLSAWWKKINHTKKMKRIERDYPELGAARRKEDGILVQYFESNKLILDRVILALERGHDIEMKLVEALAGMRVDLQNHTRSMDEKLGECRSGCIRMHERMDSIFKGQHA